MGANVTIPHKEAALAAADTATDAARAIGAANSLSFDGARVEADNTDAPGFLAALGEPPAGRAVVLGAGGARARSRGRCAPRAPRSRCGTARPSARSASRRSWGSGRWRRSSPVGCSSTAPRSAWRPARTRSPRCRSSRAGWGNGSVVADLVYGEGETALIRAAREAGARVVDGLEVLVRQGALSFERWTGVPAPLEAMRAAAGR